VVYTNGRIISKAIGGTVDNSGKGETPVGGPFNKLGQPSQDCSPGRSRRKTITRKTEEALGGKHSKKDRTGHCFNTGPCQK